MRGLSKRSLFFKLVCWSIILTFTFESLGFANEPQNSAPNQKNIANSIADAKQQNSTINPETELRDENFLQENTLFLYSELAVKFLQQHTPVWQIRHKIEPYLEKTSQNLREQSGVEVHIVWEEFLKNQSEIIFIFSKNGKQQTWKVVVTDFSDTKPSVLDDKNYFVSENKCYRIEPVRDVFRCTTRKQHLENLISEIADILSHTFSIRTKDGRANYLNRILENKPEISDIVSALVAQNFSSNPDFYNEITGAVTPQGSETIRRLLLSERFSDLVSVDEKIESYKRETLYVTLMREIRTQINDTVRLRQSEEIPLTCVGHSIDLAYKLQKQGIPCAVKCSKAMDHFWVETEDGYILDAYPEGARLVVVAQQIGLKDVVLLKRDSVLATKHYPTPIDAMSLKWFSESWQKTVQFIERAAFSVDTFYDREFLEYFRDEILKGQNQELLELFKKAISILAALDPVTRAHSIRVALLSDWIGRAAGLSKEKRAILIIAALIHDIGKLDPVVRGLILQNRLLDNNEHARIEEHTILGERIAFRNYDITNLDVLSVIRHHHENWSFLGKKPGYPDRLNGQQIPPFARIVKLADELEVATTDLRSYVTPIGLEQFLSILQTKQGGEFDPLLSATLAGLIQNTLRMTSEVEVLVAMREQALMLAEFLEKTVESLNTNPAFIANFVLETPEIAYQKHETQFGPMVICGGAEHHYTILGWEIAKLTGEIQGRTSIVHIDNEAAGHSDSGYSDAIDEFLGNRINLEHDLKLMRQGILNCATVILPAHKRIGFHRLFDISGHIDEYSYLFEGEETVHKARKMNFDRSRIPALTVSAKSLRNVRYSALLQAIMEDPDELGDTVIVDLDIDVFKNLGVKDAKLDIAKTDELIANLKTFLEFLRKNNKKIIFSITLSRIWVKEAEVNRIIAILEQMLFERTGVLDVGKCYELGKAPRETAPKHPITPATIALKTSINISATALIAAIVSSFGMPFLVLGIIVFSLIYTVSNFIYNLATMRLYNEMLYNKASLNPEKKQLDENGLISNVRGLLKDQLVQLGMNEEVAKTISDGIDIQIGNPKKSPWAEYSLQNKTLRLSRKCALSHNAILQMLLRHEALHIILSQEIPPTLLSRKFIYYICRVLRYLPLAEEAIANFGEGLIILRYILRNSVKISVIEAGIKNISENIFLHREHFKENLLKQVESLAISIVAQDRFQKLNKIQQKKVLLCLINIKRAPYKEGKPLTRDLRGAYVSYPTHTLRIVYAITALGNPFIISITNAQELRLNHHEIQYIRSELNLIRLQLQPHFITKSARVMGRVYKILPYAIFWFFAIVGFSAFFQFYLTFSVSLFLASAIGIAIGTITDTVDDLFGQYLSDDTKYSLLQTIVAFFTGLFVWFEYDLFKGIIDNHISNDLPISLLMQVIFKSILLTVVSFILAWQYSFLPFIKHYLRGEKVEKFSLKQQFNKTVSFFLDKPFYAAGFYFITGTILYLAVGIGWISNSVMFLLLVARGLPSDIVTFAAENMSEAVNHAEKKEKPNDSRGLEGLPNDRFTPELQSSIDNGLILPVQYNGQTTTKIPFMHEARGEIPLDTLKYKDQDLSILTQAIDALSEQDRELLQQVQLIFFEGEREAHYGISRNQIYINIRYIDNLPKLIEALHHELQERNYIITEMDKLAARDSRYQNWRNRRTEQHIEEKINELAGRVHEELVLEHLSQCVTVFTGNEPSEEKRTAARKQIAEFLASQPKLTEKNQKRLKAVFRKIRPMQWNMINDDLKFIFGHKIAKEFAFSEGKPCEKVYEFDSWQDMHRNLSIEHIILGLKYAIFDYAVRRNLELAQEDQIYPIELFLAPSVHETKDEAVKFVNSLFAIQPFDHALREVLNNAHDALISYFYGKRREKKPILRIKLYESKDGICLEITDNAAGIGDPTKYSRSHLEAVADMYEQYDGGFALATNKKSQKGGKYMIGGLGQGAANATAQVLHLGGRIKAENLGYAGERRGTRVTIIFPKVARRKSFAESRMLPISTAHFYSQELLPDTHDTRYFKEQTLGIDPDKPMTYEEALSRAANLSLYKIGDDYIDVEIRRDGVFIRNNTTQEELFMPVSEQERDPFGFFDFEKREAEKIYSIFRNVTVNRDDSKIIMYSLYNFVRETPPKRNICFRLYNKKGPLVACSFDRTDTTENNTEKIHFLLEKNGDQIIVHTTAEAFERLLHGTPCLPIGMVITEQLFIHTFFLRKALMYLLDDALLQTLDMSTSVRRELIPQAYSQLLSSGYSIKRIYQEMDNILSAPTHYARMSEEDLESRELITDDEFLTNVSSSAEYLPDRLIYFFDVRSGLEKEFWHSCYWGAREQANKKKLFKMFLRELARRIKSQDSGTEIAARDIMDDDIRALTVTDFQRKVFCKGTKDLSGILTSPDLIKIAGLPEGTQLTLEEAHKTFFEWLEKPQTEPSRGLEGLPNDRFTPELQSSIDNGFILPIQYDGTTTNKIPFIHEARGEIPIEQLKYKDQDLTVLNQAIEQLSDQDRELLKQVQLIFFEGEREAHYGISRNQIYINIRHINNLDKLIEALHHELQERNYIITEMDKLAARDSRYQNWRNRRTEKHIEDKINELAGYMHRQLIQLEPCHIVLLQVLNAIKNKKTEEAQALFEKLIFAEEKDFKGLYYYIMHYKNFKKGALLLFWDAMFSKDIPFTMKRPLLKRLRDELHSGDIPIPEVEWQKISEKDIKFSGKNIGRFFEVRSSQYKGGVFVSKIVSVANKAQRKKEANYLIPQANILNYLNRIGFPDIEKAIYFLELSDGRKVILFEKFDEGMTLKDKIEQYPLFIETNEALDVILNLLDIIISLNDVGVTHWDIKPDNIWMSNTGYLTIFDCDFAYITDKEFLKRGLDKAGTIMFMSQERLEGLSTRENSEVYAIAITLADILTGNLFLYTLDFIRLTKQKQIMRGGEFDLSTLFKQNRENLRYITEGIHPTPKWLRLILFEILYFEQRGVRYDPYSSEPESTPMTLENFRDELLRSRQLGTSRGLEGLPNDRFTPELQSSIDNGLILPVQYNGQTTTKIPFMHEARGEIPLDTLKYKDQDLTVLNKAIEQLSDQDRELLKQVQLIFFEGERDAHYGISRNQIYINIRYIDNLPKLIEALHHELQERNYIITEMDKLAARDSRYQNWRNRREEKHIEEKINELAKKMHEKLIMQQSSISTSKSSALDLANQLLKCKTEREYLDLALKLARLDTDEAIMCMSVIYSGALYSSYKTIILKALAECSNKKALSILVPELAFNPSVVLESIFSILKKQNRPFKEEIESLLAEYQSSYFYKYLEIRAKGELEGRAALPELISIAQRDRRYYVVVVETINATMSFPFVLMFDENRELYMVKKGKVYDSVDQMLRDLEFREDNKIVGLDVAAGLEPFADEMEGVVKDGFPDALFLAMDYSRDRMRQSRVKKDKKIVADARHLPFQNGVFDIVSVNNCDRGNVAGHMSETKRVLNENGVLLFLPYLMWHNFRGQFVKHMLENGFTVEEVALPSDYPVSSRYVDNGKLLVARKFKPGRKAISGRINDLNVLLKYADEERLRAKDAYQKVLVEKKEEELNAQFISGNINAQDFVEGIIGTYQCDSHVLQQISHYDSTYNYGDIGLNDPGLPKGWHQKKLTACLDVIERTVPDPSRKEKYQEALRYLWREQDYGRWGVHPIFEISFIIIRMAADGGDVEAATKSDIRKLVLSILSDLEEIVNDSQDKLQTILRITTIGNVLDTAALDLVNLNRELSSSQEKLLPKAREACKQTVFWKRCDFDAINERLAEKPMTIIYVLDNAGEDMFDFILIKYLLNAGHRVIIAAKSGPAVNDTTAAEMADLLKSREVRKFFGEKISNLSVIPTGTLAQGLNLARASEEFVAACQQADFAIFKGQANYETVRNYGFILDSLFLLNVKVKLGATKDFEKGDFVAEFVPAPSRGLEGLPNDRFTPELQEAIDNGLILPVDYNGRFALKSKYFLHEDRTRVAEDLLEGAEYVDEEGVKIPLAELKYKYVDLATLNKAIEQLSDQDRELLQQVQLIFFEGERDAHYGISRNQIYINIRHIDNLDKLIEALHHELQERIYIINEMDKLAVQDKRYTNWKNRRGEGHIEAKITELAEYMHFELITEQSLEQEKLKFIGKLEKQTLEDAWDIMRKKIQAYQFPNETIRAEMFGLLDLFSDLIADEKVFFEDESLEQVKISYTPEDRILIIGREVFRRENTETLSRYILRVLTGELLKSDDTFEDHYISLVDDIYGHKEDDADYLDSEEGFTDDGFISQGTEAKREFETRKSEVRSPKSEVTTQYKDKIASLVEMAISKGNLSSEQIQKLRELVKKITIYGYESIARGPDDFHLGEYDTDTNELFLATDLIAELINHGPPTLVDEYILHEILCPILGHYQAIALQQILFPEHYVTQSKNIIEGTITTEDSKIIRCLIDQTNQNKIYKGKLGEALRSFINMADTSYIQQAKEITQQVALPQGERKATLYLHHTIIDLLHPEDLDEITQILNTNYPQETDIRSLQVELRHPITHINGQALEFPIEIIQLKGVVFDATQQLKAHQGKGAISQVAQTNRMGFIYNIPGPVIPQGACYLEDAINEFIKTEDVRNDKRVNKILVAKFPIGWGEIYAKAQPFSIDGENKRLGFVILGGSRQQMNREIRMADRNCYMQNIGRALRVLHDAGYFSCLLHLENIKFFDGGKRAFIHDLESYGSLQGDRVTKEEILARQFIDIIFILEKYAMVFSGKTGLPENQRRISSNAKGLSALSGQSLSEVPVIDQYFSDRAVLEQVQGVTVNTLAKMLFFAGRDAIPRVDNSFIIALKVNMERAGLADWGLGYYRRPAIQDPLLLETVSREEAKLKMHIESLADEGLSGLSLRVPSVEFSIGAETPNKRFLFLLEENKIVLYISGDTTQQSLADALWMAYAEWFASREREVFTEEAKITIPQDDEERYKKYIKDSGLIPADISGKKVLDVGAGRGVLTSLLGEAGAGMVVALDLSTEILKNAHTKHAGNIEFVTGSVFKLPFADESFDDIFVSFMLNYLPEPLRIMALKEILRVLKPGGRLHIFDHQRVAYPNFNIRGMGWSIQEWKDNLERLGYSQVEGKTYEEIMAKAGSFARVPTNIIFTLSAKKPEPKNIDIEIQAVGEGLYYLYRLILEKINSAEITDDLVENLLQIINRKIIGINSGSVKKLKEVLAYIKSTPNQFSWHINDIFKFIIENVEEDGKRAELESDKTKIIQYALDKCKIPDKILETINYENLPVLGHGARQIAYSYTYNGIQYAIVKISPDSRNAPFQKVQFFAQRDVFAAINPLGERKDLPFVLQDNNNVDNFVLVMQIFPEGGIFADSAPTAEVAWAGNAMQQTAGQPKSAGYEPYADFSNRQKLLIFLYLAKTIQHLRAEHVIHRDVKPQNVLIPRSLLANTDWDMEDIEKNPPLLFDFDISRLLNAEETGLVGDYYLPYHDAIFKMQGTPLVMYIGPNTYDNYANSPVRDIFHFAATMMIMLGQRPATQQGWAPYTQDEINNIISSQIPVNLKNLLLNIMKRDPGEITWTWDDIIRELETQLVSLPAPAKVSTPDGFISQGTEAKREFETRKSEVRSPKSDITQQYKDRISTLVETAISRGNISPVNAQRLRDLIKKLTIYGYESIVRGPDDFHLGEYDTDTNELFLAQDLIAELINHGPPTLVDEYILHEILCPILGHYEAIALQQIIFSEHYPKRTKSVTKQLEDGTFYTFDKSKGKIHKGMLGDLLREHIDKQAVSSSDLGGVSIDFNSKTKLDETLKNRIRKIANWETTADFTKGRSGYIVLDVPLELEITTPSGKKKITIKAIQIKSIGDFREPTRYGKPGDGSFVLSEQFPTLHEIVSADLEIYPQAVPAIPRGGDEVDAIDTEYRNMETAFNNGSSATVPLAKGRYLERKWNGKDIGFIVIGIFDEEDLRLSDVFEGIEVKKGKKISFEISDARVKRIIPKITDSDNGVELLKALFYEWGRALGDLSDKAGLYHPNPYAGNLSFNGIGCCVHDFCSAIRKEELTPEQAYLQEIVGPLTSGLADIERQLFTTSVGHFILVNQREQINPYLEFLKGYFGRNADIIISELVLLADDLMENTRDMYYQCGEKNPGTSLTNVANGIVFRTASERLFVLMAKIADSKKVKQPFGQKDFNDRLKEYYRRKIKLAQALMKSGRIPTALSTPEPAESAYELVTFGGVETGDESRYLEIAEQVYMEIDREFKQFVKTELQIIQPGPYVFAKIAADFICAMAVYDDFEKAVSVIEDNRATLFLFKAKNYDKTILGLYNMYNILTVLPFDKNVAEFLSAMGRYMACDHVRFLESENKFSKNPPALGKPTKGKAYTLHAGLDFVQYMKALPKDKTFILLAESHFIAGFLDEAAKLLGVNDRVTVRIIDSTQDNTVPTPDGFISQGTEAKREFEARKSEVRSPKSDITQQYKDRISVLVETAISRGNISPVNAQRLRDLIKKLTIYGYESIVRGPDDFHLGEYDTDTNELFLATDLIAELINHGPPTLVDEYILHEILCPILGHYQAIALQQIIFPEHYVTQSKNIIEGTITTENGETIRCLIDETNYNKIYKGKLGLVIRGWIIKQEILNKITDSPLRSLNIKNIDLKKGQKPKFVYKLNDPQKIKCILKSLKNEKDSGLLDLYKELQKPHLAKVLEAISLLQQNSALDISNLEIHIYEDEIYIISGDKKIVILTAAEHVTFIPKVPKVTLILSEISTHLMDLPRDFLEDVARSHGEEEFLIIDPLVDLHSIAPDMIVNMRYATAENCAGRKLYFSKPNKCYLRQSVAEALAKVDVELRKQGYCLEVWDGYRSQFIQWSSQDPDIIPDADTRNLFAHPRRGSRHSEGRAVDVTLQKLNDDGTTEELKMPTDFDSTNEKAYTEAGVPLITEEEFKNKQILQEAMIKGGFSKVKYEWWHFNLCDFEKQHANNTCLTLDIPYRVLGPTDRQYIAVKKDNQGYSVYTLTNTETNTSIAVTSLGGNMIGITKNGVEILKTPPDIATLEKEKHRWGQPVLFPSPSFVTNNGFTYEGVGCRFDTPDGKPFMHGLVANKKWKTKHGVSDDGEFIECSIDSKDYPDIGRQFPFPFKLIITYTLNKSGSITTRVKVKNTAKNNAPANGRLPFGFGFHTNFQTKDKSKWRLLAPFPALWDYDGKISGEAARQVSLSQYPQYVFNDGQKTLDSLNRTVILTEPTVLTPDRKTTYVLYNQEDNIFVQITVDELFQNLAVFPQENYTGLEPWTSRPDAHNRHAQGKTDSGLAILEPGQECELETNIVLYEIHKLPAKFSLGKLQQLVNKKFQEKREHEEEECVVVGVDGIPHVGKNYFCEMFDNNPQVAVLDLDDFGLSNEGREKLSSQIAELKAQGVKIIFVGGYTLFKKSAGFSCDIELKLIADADTRLDNFYKKHPDMKPLSQGRYNLTIGLFGEDQDANMIERRDLIIENSIPSRIPENTKVKVEFRNGEVIFTTYQDADIRKAPFTLVSGQSVLNKLIELGRPIGILELADAISLQRTNSNISFLRIELNILVNSQEVVVLGDQYLAKRFLSEHAYFMERNPQKDTEVDITRYASQVSFDEIKKLENEPLAALYSSCICCVFKINGKLYLGHFLSSDSDNIFLPIEEDLKQTDTVEIIFMPHDFAELGDRQTYQGILEYFKKRNKKTKISFVRLPEEFSRQNGSEYEKALSLEPSGLITLGTYVILRAQTCFTYSLEFAGKESEAQSIPTINTANFENFISYINSLGTSQVNNGTAKRIIIDEDLVQGMPQDLLSAFIRALTSKFSGTIIVEVSEVSKNIYSDRDKWASTATITTQEKAGIVPINKSMVLAASNPDLIDVETIHLVVTLGIGLLDLSGSRTQPEKMARVLELLNLFSTRQMNENDLIGTKLFIIELKPETANLGKASEAAKLIVQSV